MTEVRPNPQFADPKETETKGRIGPLTLSPKLEPPRRTLHWILRDSIIEIKPTRADPKQWTDIW